MKKLIAAVLLSILLSFGVAPAVNAAAPSQSTGGGTVNVEGQFWTFSFNALQLDASSGEARGHFNFVRNPGAQSFIKGDILYLWVNANKAWIGFVIVNTNDPAYNIGQDIVFEVQDSPDRISNPEFEPASYVKLEQDLFSSTAAFNWTHGNIRVR